MNNNINVAVGGPINADYPKAYKTKFLKPGIPFSLQVTEPNTKYVIRHNFVLDGNVTIPEGCLLEFDGGSISNGTLVGQDTVLIYFQSLDEILPDVIREGSFVYNNTLSADEESLTEKGNLVSIKDKGIKSEHIDDNQILTNHILNENITGNKLNPNVVDDEDIHFTVDHKLQLKDKAYAPANYSGLGRKYLRKNINQVSGVNILTQDMMPIATEEGQEDPGRNTIYVIQYDFTLGEDITIPENCVLEFDGGSLSGGVIIFNNTFLKGDINIDCEFHGTVSNTKVFSDWFNALSHPVRTINNMIEVADCIFLGDGTYLIDGIYNSAQKGYFQLKSGLKIEGESKTGTIIKLGENRWTDSKSIFYGYEINDLEVTNITFDINGKENIIPSAETARWTNLRIIEVKYGSNINIHNVNMKDNPGRQCISLGTGTGDITNPDNYSIKNVRIEDCQFIDVSRSSDGGIYQNDHSSIFALVDTIFVNNNYFYNSKENTALTLQKSSAIEVHGINAIVTNNTTINYSRGLNIAATHCNSRDIIVKDNTFKNVTCGIMLYTNSALNLRDVSIFNNRISCINTTGCGGIQQNDDEEFTLPDSCTIKNNLIIGNNISNTASRGAIYFKYDKNSYIEISDNTIKNFNACAINIQGSSTERDSFLSITNNIFDNCGGVTTSTTERDNNIVYLIGSYIKTFILENNKVVNSPRADIRFFRTSITTAITLIIKENICCDCTYIYFSNNIDATNIVFDAITFDSIDITKLGGTNVSYKNKTRKYQKVSNAKAAAVVKSIAYGTAVPVDGSWEKGDLVINYDTANYAPLGWVCTERGTPGTWRPIGFNINGYKIEGVTASKPTDAIRGSRYIDRTLGYTIEYNGSKWIDWDGAKAGVLRSGTFANKPAAADIYVGFKYFCTNKQTTEGATNGIEIIFKDQDTTDPDNPVDVWVDALGRVVS